MDFGLLYPRGKSFTLTTLLWKMDLKDGDDVGFEGLGLCGDLGLDRRLGLYGGGLGLRLAWLSGVLGLWGRLGLNEGLGLWFEGL